MKPPSKSESPEWVPWAHRREAYEESLIGVIQVTSFNFRLRQDGAMPSGFYVYRRLEDGQVLTVAWRKDAERAAKLVSELNELWPGEYGCREAHDEPLSVGPDSVANRKYGPPDHCSGD